MKLYDKNISEIQEMVESFSCRKYEDTLSSPFHFQSDKSNQKAIRENAANLEWPTAEDDNLILRHEMAYELGGADCYAVSAMGFTSQESLVSRDEIIQIGPDLPQIKNDTAYARLVFVKVADDFFKDSNAAYSTMRQIEYTRYHVSPKGYMMRISTANNREAVRVGKDALLEGLDFQKVGKIFSQAYHEHPQVQAVKIVFITAPEFPYAELQKHAIQMEQITESLNHILKDLKMDCSICNLKPVCDEVEGMRELHFGANGKQKA
jgi:CO dehydrogenase/acetyl-CoA synthase beta subunit